VFDISSELFGVKGPSGPNDMPFGGKNKLTGAGIAGLSRFAEFS